MRPKGFEYTDILTDPPAKRHVFFIDKHGKDCSFERWRLCLYYLSHCAATHFEPTEQAYNDFIAKCEPDCYQNYDDYRATFNE